MRTSRGWTLREGTDDFETQDFGETKAARGRRLSEPHRAGSLPLASWSAPTSTPQFRSRSPDPSTCAATPLLRTDVLVIGGGHRRGGRRPRAAADAGAAVLLASQGLPRRRPTPPTPRAGLPRCCCPMTATPCTPTTPCKRRRRPRRPQRHRRPSSRAAPMPMRLAGWNAWARKFDRAGNDPRGAYKLSRAKGATPSSRGSIHSQRRLPPVREIQTHPGPAALRRAPTGSRCAHRGVCPRPPRP